MQGKDEIRIMPATRFNSFLVYALAHGDNYNTSGSRIAGVDVLRGLREADCPSPMPGEENYSADMSAMLHAWAFPGGTWDARFPLTCETVDGYMKGIMAAKRTLRKDADGDNVLAHAQFKGLNGYLDAVGRAIAAVVWFERWTWAMTYNEFSRPRYGRTEHAAKFFRHQPAQMSQAEVRAMAGASNKAPVPPTAA